MAERRTLKVGDTIRIGLLCGVIEELIHSLNEDWVRVSIDNGSAYLYRLNEVEILEKKHEKMV